MIGRVRLANSGIALENLEGLRDHIEGNNDFPDEIAPLYDLLPDRVKHRGDIYRGLGLGLNMDVFSLLRNAAFKTSEKVGTVESWSASYVEATSFATSAVYSDHKAGGVVLKSSIVEVQEDILMDLSPKAHEYFSSLLVEEIKERELIDEEREDSTFIIVADSLHTTLDEYKAEQEILIRHTGGKMYVLCEDVVTVAINTNEFNERHMDKLYEVLKSDRGMSSDEIKHILGHMRKISGYPLVLDCNAGQLRVRK